MSSVRSSGSNSRNAAVSDDDAGRARPVDEALTDGRRTAFWETLRHLVMGRRFIDLPIRAIAVLLALAALIPGSAESSDPLYLVFFYGVSVMLVVEAFLPGGRCGLRAVISGGCRTGCGLTPLSPFTPRA